MSFKVMKTFAVNRKARYNYDILEEFEAGLVLNGQEVKSIKAGRVSLGGSYVVLKNEELWLVGANIPAYQPKNAPLDYQPERWRKLLVKSSEIRYLIGKSKQKGLTMAPLRLYSKRGKIKLGFALVKGRKKKDKREQMRKREFEREKARAMKKWG